MKSWSQIESDPNFHASPEEVKSEVRGFYLKSLESSPEFQGLPPEEQEKIRRYVGDGVPLPIKMAAQLIAGAMTGKVDQAILVPNKEGLIELIFKGAKNAEGALEVPLKERPNNAETLPANHFHINEQLKSYMAFIEEGLPEYHDFKAWEQRKALTLPAKIEDVKSTIEPVQPDPRLQALITGGEITSYPALAQRLPIELQDLRIFPPEVQDAVIQKDPEAAVKTGLPIEQWGMANQMVGQVVARFLSGAQAFNDPEAMMTVRDSIVRTAYELLARKLYRVPSNKPQLTDPLSVADLVMASDAEMVGMSKVASSYPWVYAFLSGMAALPYKSRGRWLSWSRETAEEMNLPQGQPITTEILFIAIKQGSTSFINLANLDRSIFIEAVKEKGINPAIMERMHQDLLVAAKNPVDGSIVYTMEKQDREKFEGAVNDAKEQIMLEVQRILVKAQEAPAPVAQDQPQPDSLDDIKEVFEDGASLTLIPEKLAFLDPEPDNPVANA